MNQPEKTFLKQKLENLRLHFQPISLSQKLFFTKNLQVMIKAGLPLSTAIRTLSQQTVNKKFKVVLLEMSGKIEKGDNLAKTLKDHPEIFSEVFIYMVEAGEKSGNLEEVLGELTTQLKKTHELMAKIKGALAYPIFVVSAMLGIGTLMMIFVVPKIVDIFAEFDTKLPIATRVLIFVSNNLIKHGILTVVSGLILVVILVKLSRTKKGKYLLHKILLKTPIFGVIIKKINLAKFSRTFCSLLKTDIPIVQTMEITSKVLGNKVYEEYVLAKTENIKRGEAIAKALSQNPKIFPPVVTQMVEVGEKTGTLDNILEDLAEFYEEDVSQAMSGLSSIIEPILILILGVAVAGMAIAIIMPMYTLTQQI